jgi:hypothetical protein
MKTSILSLRSLRFLAPLGLALTAMAAPGCEGESTESDSGDVTDVKNSSVKNQSIGNCWVYASVGWAESLHLTQTGNTLNISESWISYWHWYEQIAGAPTGEGAVATLDAKTQLTTGAWFGVAAELMRRYGVIDEGAFIPEEAEAARSSRQSSALSAINTSLKSGVLSDAAKRKDRKLVRAELDKAWGLKPEVIKLMDDTFGADANKTFGKGTAKVPTGTTTLRSANAIEVGKNISLGDAIGAPKSKYDVKTRTGKYAWNDASYPSSASARRAIQIKAQRAMHEGMPVIMTWFVDFAALKSNVFAEPPVTPGSQGGHMTALEDYQINDVPGYGTLAAGTLVTEKAKLDAALSPSAKIEFFRIKNSWGSSLAPPNASDDLRGYYDLHMKYLDASLTKCTEKNGDKCGTKTQTPGLWAFTLPPDAFLTDRVGTEGACLDECTIGPARAASCSDCTDLICSEDPYCCSTEWDQVCANLAVEICEIECD